MKKAGNQTFVKETNKKLIVDLLKKTGPLSRADIRKFINLSAPTISTNVSRLMEENLLRKSGRASSMGGRTTNFYDVNYDFGYILSIDLSQKETLIGLSNLRPEMIAMKKFDLKSKKYKTCLEELFFQIETMTREHNIDLDRIVTISVSSPGVLKENGKLDYVDDEDWFYKKPVFDDIKEKYNKKVIVENDVNLAVLAESKSGTGNSFSYMGYLKIDKGLGAGFMLEDKILRGKDGIAGEMGVSLLKNNSGQKVTLESIFELDEICEDLKKVIENGQNSKIKELVSGNLDNITIDIIGKAAIMGDKLALKKLRFLAEHLASSISHIFSILGLEVLIIGGHIKFLGKPFLDEIREYLKPELPFDITIAYSSLNEEVALMGSFYLGKKYFFDNFYKNI